MSSVQERPTEMMERNKFLFLGYLDKEDFPSFAHPGLLFLPSYLPLAFVTLGGRKGALSWYVYQSGWRGRDEQGKQAELSVLADIEI